MAVSSLQAAVEALQRLERPQLEELALGYVRSHVRICRLAGVEHVEESHASDAELARRVGELSVEELAGLLGPAALLSLIACQSGS